MEKEKEKRLYVGPVVSVTAVEIESSICADSVTIQNPAGTHEIENQTVNDGFGGDFAGQNWEDVTSQN